VGRAANTREGLACTDCSPNTQRGGEGGIRAARDGSRAKPENDLNRHGRARARGGGEGGIRTLTRPLDSVTGRCHSADVAVNASDAVAPCPRLPAGSASPWLWRQWCHHHTVGLNI
jgi:hypothetical protein